MNTKRIVLISLLAGFLSASIISRADDIDIYSSISSVGDLPNVLIVLDTSANFNASAAACTYSAPNSAVAVGYSGKAGGVEQCALNNVIATLPVNTVNIGVMIYNANVLNGRFPQCNSSGNGGCLLVPLTKMDAAGKTSIMTKIQSWGTTTATQIDSSGESDASTMQEAWAYYAGKTGMSGTTYTSPAAAGCQKNFVIFIGNAFGPSASPGDGAGAAPGANLTTTITNNTALTAAQKTVFKSILQIPAGAYGTTATPNLCGTYAMGTHNESSGLYLDEWARYMNGTDLVTGKSPAVRNINTYAIGVLGSTCKPDWPALLKNTAENAGGKYYATSNYNEIAQAILQILNEVQAVNSVFSSSSLPVSVNTQGTYLNQIYMGMFRPDGGGNPRWVGNLKQYQFKLDTLTQTLFLADAIGEKAISGSGTGFIGTDAISFWTCTNTNTNTNNPFVQVLNTLYKPAAAALSTCLNNTDPVDGFWKNNSEYVNNSSGFSWDLMDGQIVEKGGAAQMLRNYLMNADFTTAAGTSTNPRRLYTYCPSETGCNADLTNAANAFSAANANAGNITASMFGAGGSITVQSITRSGTTVTVTTNGAHGLQANGTNVVTIAGAIPGDYNGTYVIASTTSSTFTYVLTNPEYPVTPIASTPPTNYTAAPASGSALTLNTPVTRGLANGTNTAIVTATISSGGTVAGASGTVTGAVPSDYNGTVTFLTNVGSTFTYSVTVNPPATAATPANYSVQLSNHVAANLNTTSGYQCIKQAAFATFTTVSDHGFLVGDYVTISGNAVAAANASFTIASITSTKSFTVTQSCPNGQTATGGGGTVIPGPTAALALTALTRTEATTVGIGVATATVATSNRLATGDKVSITNASVPSNSTAYIVSNAAITCTTTACTSFTYAISTTPAQPSGTMKVSAPVTAFAINTLTRAGSLATATLSGASTVTDGSIVDINPISGFTSPSSESAYTGSWTITCTVPVGGPCGTFTYGPLTLTPTTPASGSITAFSATATLDKDALIRWVRGADNVGDEKSLCPPLTTTGTANCPATRVTVRPSVHGDVLHSRPITVNYGGSTGVVVYYASNDGIYHAVNGNQHTFVNSSTGATVTDNNAGNEIWGFVPSDFFAKLTRQRSNLPMLKLPSTPTSITPAPQKKDYFADGPTGLYQLISGDTTTAAAYLYIGMRRGGNIIYALDASTPATPRFLWKLSSATDGFNELGQTWSLPKVTRVKGYANPVVIFGGGYDDGAEDAEPPTASTMGRAIYIVDYLTGALVWRAAPAAPTTLCTTLQCKVQVSGMTHSIPSDLTLMDSDSDGKVDRIYATDVGGNVWRVDLEPTAGYTPDKWQITKLAALGCSTGTCASGTTPRKFFFPAEIISGTSTNNYDAIIVGSGDREHPLKTNQSYNIVNRLYVLQDRAQGKDAGSQTTITETAGTTSNLYNCTTNCTSSTPYAGQNFGYYITLQGLIPDPVDPINNPPLATPGEKAVNAPLVAAGTVYFGTNQPTSASDTTCSTNLGIARGYQLDPFGGFATISVFDGGGMPPSPIAGVVNVVDENGETKQYPFLIGAGSPKLGGCKSALCGTDLDINVPTTRSRTYWYLEGK